MKKWEEDLEENLFLRIYRWVGGWEYYEKMRRRFRGDCVFKDI